MAFSMFSVSLLLWLGMSVANADNLARNGDFSQGQQAWDMKNQELNRIASEGDNRFARFTMDKQGLTMIEQKVALEPDMRELKVSARLRGANISPAEGGGKDARLMFYFVDAEGKNVGGYHGLALKKSTDGWVNEDKTVRVPTGAMNLLLRPGLYSTSGQFDIDDITVEVTERGAPTPEPFSLTEPRTAPQAERMLDTVEPVTGVNLPELKIAHTLTVNPAGGADFSTIAEALERAVALKAEGQGVKLILEPGIYREGELYISNATGTAPLVIEARKSGTAILAGSVPASGLEEGEGGIWSLEWKHDWGLNRHWWTKFGVTMEPVALRREMVWIAGERLRQVLSRDELVEGTFFVDEDADRIFFQPLAGKQPREGKIEVTDKTYGLGIVEARNVVVRGLTFRGYANTIGLRKGVPINWDFPGGCALGLNTVKDVLVEDVLLLENNDTGLDIKGLENVTLRTVRSLRNGGGGFAGGHLVNVRFEDCTANENNWRGFWGGYTGWSMAGIKVTRLDGVTFLNFTSNDNLCYGFWFDIWGEDILIDGLVSRGNLKGGAYIEWQQGPTTIIDSDLSYNKGIGLLLSGSANVRVEDTRIIGNATQISMRDDFRTRPLHFFFKNNVIASVEPGIPGIHEATDKKGNVVAEADGTLMIASYQYWLPDFPGFTVEAQPLLMPKSSRAWPLFLKTLRAEGNTWYHPSQRYAFLDEDRHPIEFDEWKKLTGDASAQWKNPVGKTEDWQARPDRSAELVKPVKPDPMDDYTVSAQQGWPGPVLRINAGTEQRYTDREGNTWLPDTFNQTGQLYTAIGENDGTITRKKLMESPPSELKKHPAGEIFASERYDVVGYKIAVPEKGDYTVVLHFSEAFQKGTTPETGREFEVVVNDDRVIEVNPYKETGGYFRPLTKQIEGIQPRDGVIELRFLPGISAHGPQINGIEIIRET